jgi:hypothetical protein
MLRELMGRYILRYENAPVAPDENIQAILKIPGIEIVDRSPNMLLVDADEGKLREGLGGLQGWSLHPEQQYPLPDSRRNIV